MTVSTTNRALFAKTFKVAIYTRVSTDEGLALEFNSLDAQREACQAYITSQRHEGWEELDDCYDDGGYSGGTMKRPALERLLSDVRAGRVDIIVVYKIDRLTRSLSDFSRIVDVLDAHHASFISITQSFSTTTSMGRLTLNVLLSFAQFEREVGAERVRDKIASSKKKGMWMGGLVPLGYDVVERKLIVHDAEADTVRLIFDQFLSVRSVVHLRTSLAKQGVLPKRRKVNDENADRKSSFTLSSLYNLLKNVTYIGRVAHKGQTYSGQHEAIINETTFNEVQNLLAQNRANRRHCVRARPPCLLTGLLFDERGFRLSPTFTTKGSRRFRYYMSKSSCDGSGRPFRVSAAELERVILTSVSTWLGDPAKIEEILQCAGCDPVALDALQFVAGVASGELRAASSLRHRELLMVLVEHVQVKKERLIVQLSPQALFAMADLARPKVHIPAFSLEVPLRTRRSLCNLGSAMTPNGHMPTRPDPSLVKLLVKSFAAREALFASGGGTLADVAKTVGHEPHYFSVLVKLSYLAPDIVRAILHGRQPVQLNRQKLARIRKLPFTWEDQRSLLEQFC